MEEKTKKEEEERYSNINDSESYYNKIYVILSYNMTLWH